MVGNTGSAIGVQEAIPTTAAGTSAVNGNTIDTANFEGVECVVKFGTAALDNTIKAQGGELSNGSDMADLADTEVGVTVADSGIVRLDVVKPRHRYIRFVAARGTSTTVDWGVALKYGARTLPAASAVVDAAEVHVSPAYGTA